MAELKSTRVQNSPGQACVKCESGPEWRLCAPPFLPGLQAGLPYSFDKNIGHSTVSGMQARIEGEVMTFVFTAPATVEIASDELLVPDQLPVKIIELDFQNVRILSSVVIGSLLQLINQESGRRRIKINNVGHELWQIFERTGLKGIMQELQ